MGLDEIGRIKVGKTKAGDKQGIEYYTFKQLFDELVNFIGEWQHAAKIEGVELMDLSDERKNEIIAKMPLYGEKMWLSRDGGNSCWTCELRKECDLISGGI